MTEDTVPLFKKIASNALDWRGVVNLLKCSKQEFERWRDDGKFPEPDGEVLSHTFTSMNRAYNHMADGWLPETVGAIRPYIEDWRAEHKEALKIKKKKAKALRDCDVNVELWCEKEALSGIIWDIASDCDVPVVSQDSDRSLSIEE